LPGLFEEETFFSPSAFDTDEFSSLDVNSDGVLVGTEPVSPGGTDTGPGTGPTNPGTGTVNDEPPPSSPVEWLGVPRFVAPPDPEPVVDDPDPVTPEPVVDDPDPVTPEPVVDDPDPVTPDPVGDDPDPVTPDPVDNPLDPAPGRDDPSDLGLGIPGQNKVAAEIAAGWYEADPVADTFVLNTDWGVGTVTDFVDGERIDSVIAFSSSLFADFADLQMHMEQVGDDVVITEGDNMLTIRNTDLAQLGADDFSFF
jgi:hypothetical protein